MEITLYRKDSPGKPPKKLTKAQTESFAEKLALVSRVNRPALVSFLMDRTDGFYALPALPAAVIDNRATRILEHKGDGWVIPLDDLGRVKDAVASGDTDAARKCAQSVLLWIKQRCPELVNAAHVSVVVQ